MCGEGMANAHERRWSEDEDLEAPPPRRSLSTLPTLRMRWDEQTDMLEFPGPCFFTEQVNPKATPY